MRFFLPSFRNLVDFFKIRVLLLRVSWFFSPFELYISYQVSAGTPEAGGWTTRELKRILRGLAGLNFVYVLLSRSFSDRLLKIALKNRGADIVEVAPAYDNGEQAWHSLSERSADCSFSWNHWHCCRWFCAWFPFNVFGKGTSPTAISPQAYKSGLNASGLVPFMMPKVHG